MVEFRINHGNKVLADNLSVKYWTDKTRSSVRGQLPKHIQEQSTMVTIVCSPALATSNNLIQGVISGISDYLVNDKRVTAVICVQSFYHLGHIKVSVEGVDYQ